LFQIIFPKKFSAERTWVHQMLIREIPSHEAKSLPLRENETDTTLEHGSFSSRSTTAACLPSNSHTKTLPFLQPLQRKKYNNWTEFLQFNVLPSNQR
jgi:hypothetical protein